jgi:hypothetical protein
MCNKECRVNRVSPNLAVGRVARTRRLEMTFEQLVNKTTSQVVELSKKDDIINRLEVERDAQEIEIITLKTQVDALK